MIRYETITFSGGRVALESHNIILSEGQIPFENLRLNNSSNVKVRIGSQPITHSSTINVRLTGQVVLEDGTQDSIGEQSKLVLDGTDVSSTDAGDNVSFEGGTGIIP